MHSKKCLRLRSASLINIAFGILFAASSTIAKLLIAIFDGIFTFIEIQLKIPFRFTKLNDFRC